MVGTHRPAPVDEADLLVVVKSEEEEEDGAEDEFSDGDAER